MTPESDDSDYSDEKVDEVIRHPNREKKEIRGTAVPLYFLDLRQHVSPQCRYNPLPRPI